ncbi:uncharacterized protein J4E79_006594 [Alternaria viburni]|uniref:uncharacterized protein n=1 Tax=Alternaria viburni TaxID=566460 RepID=UPI0020C25724|nr:uncharacterized protein J4E79_006594 [Alternaria viburni]KAI4658835.1 hypothetical protein J4E79_006594 [Alternaria viburni]
MWDQPHKSSRSRQKQSSSYRAAPKYSSQVPRSYRDTQHPENYVSSPADSSSDYDTPRRGYYEDLPPNHRRYVNRAMASEYATQTREPRDVYGFSQPRPRHQPRSSARPQYRAQSSDPDCIAQDSQSDEDYIATPEVKKDAWKNRGSRYDDRSTDDSLGNGSPIRHPPRENYSDSPPSDYAPRPKAKSEDRRVKSGWGNSDSFSQPPRLNPREHENYREAKQFLDRFQQLHTHTTDRSDTESYSDDSPGDTQTLSKMMKMTTCQVHTITEKDTIVNALVGGMEKSLTTDSKRIAAATIVSLVQGIQIPDLSGPVYTARAAPSIRPAASQLLLLLQDM